MASPKSIFRSSMEAWHRRRRATTLPREWDVGALATDLREEVAEAERQGLLDPRLLDDFEAELVAMMLKAFPKVMAVPRDAVGFGVAEAVFGRVVYENGLDKQLATGSAAVGEVVVEEAVAVATAAVLMRFCSGRAPPDPQWPARDDGLGRSFGDGGASDEADDADPGDDADDIVGGDRRDDGYDGVTA